MVTQDLGLDLSLPYYRPTPVVLLTPLPTPPTILTPVSLAQNLVNPQTGNFVP